MSTPGGHVLFLRCFNDVVIDLCVLLLFYVYIFFVVLALAGTYADCKALIAYADNIVVLSVARVLTGNVIILVRY